MDKQSYWIWALKAAWKAVRQEVTMRASMGAGAKRHTAKRCNPRPNLDVVAVEAQIRSEMERQPTATKQVQSSATMEIQQPSNKRLKKPD